MTRFEEILPLWQKFTSIWQIFRVNFLFGKMLSLLQQFCDIIGLIFIVANSQILKSNLTIWSHWLQSVSPSLANDTHVCKKWTIPSLFFVFNLHPVFLQLIITCRAVEIVYSRASWTLELIYNWIIWSWHFYCKLFLLVSSFQQWAENIWYVDNFANDWIWTADRWQLLFQIEPQPMSVDQKSRGRTIWEQYT